MPRWEPRQTRAGPFDRSRFESGRQGGAVEQQHAQLVRFVPGRHLCGMVAVPILPDFSTEELEMIIAHSEAKALMVSDKLFAKLAKSTINPSIS